MGKRKAKKRMEKIRIKTRNLPPEVYKEILTQGYKTLLNRQRPDQYTVVTMVFRDGAIYVECYGPFSSAKLAKQHADRIEWPCIKFVEYLWGNVVENMGPTE